MLFLSFFHNKLTQLPNNVSILLWGCVGCCTWGAYLLWGWGLLYIILFVDHVVLILFMFWWYHGGNLYIVCVIHIILCEVWLTHRRRKKHDKDLFNRKHNKSKVSKQTKVITSPHSSNSPWHHGIHKRWPNNHGCSGRKRLSNSKNI